jgi:4-hydroxy-3-methylbut-2-enyl diphosphate reductase
MIEARTEITKTVETLPSEREVLIAGDKGPCGGVNMAIDTTFQVLDMIGGREKVFANNPPVHNDLIMEEFAQKGLVIQPDISLIPEGSVLLLSAHGTPPSLTHNANRRGLIVVNTECQFVSKVRRRAQSAIENGEFPVYFGAEGHPEPKAVLADLNPNDYAFVDIHGNDAPTLSGNKRIRVLNQTTLSTVEIQGRKSDLEKETGEEIPDPIGICYATDNRQDAVRSGIFGDPNRVIDRLVVVGSKISHNSKELRNIGSEILGPEYSYLVDRPEDLDESWFRDAVRIGLTSGASVIDRYTEEILRWFKERGYSLTYLPGTEKELMFKGPDLAELQNHLQQKYQN